MSHNWTRDEFNDDWPLEAEQMMLNLVNVPREHQPHACGWVVGGEACTDVLFPREFPGHLREHGVIGDDNARMSCCWSKRVAPRSGGASGIEDRMPRLRADFYTQDHFEQSPKESTPLTGSASETSSVFAVRSGLTPHAIQAKIELIGRLTTLPINRLLNELLPQSFELVAHALVFRRQFAVKPDHKKRLACVTPTGGEVKHWSTVHGASQRYLAGTVLPLTTGLNLNGEPSTMGSLLSGFCSLQAPTSLIPLILLMSGQSEPNNLVCLQSGQQLHTDVTVDFEIHTSQLEVDDQARFAAILDSLSGRPSPLLEKFVCDVTYLTAIMQVIAAHTTEAQSPGMLFLGGGMNPHIIFLPTPFPLQ
ncbi:hypothetical protein EDD15DRAFT_2377131 [Pisolithus albus]|nr:hypothetical protein EDD15DRAFT_2377131 [Pisolithus albus]